MPVFQKRTLGVGEVKSHNIVMTTVALITASFELVLARSQVQCSKYFPGVTYLTDAFSPRDDLWGRYHSCAHITYEKTKAQA